MAQININNKSYEIPERLTIEQYQKAMAFDWEDSKYYAHIVSQLSGAPIELLQQADEKSLTLAVSLIIHTMNVRSKCDMMDLSQIKFGQFVDLDIWVGMGLEKHLVQVAELLCPKAKYADQAMWAVEEFLKFRIFTFRQYKVLFGINDKELEEAMSKLANDEESSLQELDPLRVARGWYRVIVGLANDDVLKIDSITDEPLKKILNFMALQKEKALEEKQRLQQQTRQRNYDLQRASR